jgi:N-acylneuraminate cytidylyltransferase/CMP-N,N'-diacetyllegionaminic acid synthase
MYHDQSVLALIPARGGSKGLPGKNIRPLAGKPLITWTIEAALQSRLCDQVMVSADDEKIAAVARQYGAAVPFMRPPELAADEASSMDVIIHAMNWQNEHGQSFDWLLLLQPTSPLRSFEDIRKAAELLTKKRAAAVVSVCESEHSPLWMNIIGPDLNMRDFLAGEHQNKNRQQLGKYYRLNGAIYLARWDFLMERRSFFSENTYAYIMEPERSADIDRELDFKFAEFLIKNHIVASNTSQKDEG